MDNSRIAILFLFSLTEVETKEISGNIGDRDKIYRIFNIKSK